MGCKIQLALDVLTEDRALELAEATAPWVDILEAGVGVNFVLYHRSIDEETTKGAIWNE